MDVDSKAVPVGSDISQMPARNAEKACGFAEGVVLDLDGVPAGLAICKLCGQLLECLQVDLFGVSRVE